MSARGSRSRRSIGFSLPRPLPWSSVLSRVAPEVLIVVWTVLTTLLLVWPSWWTLGVLGLVLAGASLLAKVPPSAIPIPAPWFWGGVVGGLIGASLGGGFWYFVRLMALTTVVLWGTALLLWTSSTARLAGALRSLLRPLRRIGLPVDEWARIMGLALRALPVLGDQAQAVVDTAKLRMGDEWTRATPGTLLRLAVDVTTACLSAASRAARDTGRAMSMRGGLEPLEDSRPRLAGRDLVAALVGILAAGAIVAAHVLL